MKILIIHNYYRIPGGEDTVVENESKLLKEHGHEVYFYKRNNTEMDNYSLSQRILLPFNTVFSYKSYRDVLKIIVDKNIDIIHVHNTVCVISPSIYYAAFKSNIPVVQTIHNFRLICPGASLCRKGKICEECIGKSLFHSVKKRCYRNSMLNTFAIAVMESFHKFIGTYKKINYICLTEFNKKKLLSINYNKEHIIPDRIFVKPNFVVSKFNIIDFKERKNQIMYAGRLESTKGIKELFEAWAQISKYNLIVCGTGPEEKWCKQYIDKHNINNIRMLGFVPNKEVMEIIADSKALILPTQCYEGFPMVLVESFACGTPVLGSNIGNVNDIIIEKKNGIHFNHCDSKDIVRAVSELFDMTEQTIQISEKMYGSEANYNLLMNVYHKILSDGNKFQL